MIWNPSVWYPRGSVVIYANSIWLALGDNKESAPSGSNTAWSLVLQGGSGAGVIAGTIAAGEIAVGTGVDTIGALTGASASGADVSLAGNLTFATAKAIRTDTTTAHTLLLQAYDVDATATYRTFGTLTNGSTPDFTITPPSGGTVTLNATTLQRAGADAVTGVGAYKLARVEMALDGSNPTPWATGLASIISGTVTLKGSGAPGVGTSVLTALINGTSLDVYAWKVTSNSNPTLIASTGTETFYGIAIGT